MTARSTIAAAKVKEQTAQDAPGTIFSRGVATLVSPFFEDACRRGLPASLRDIEMFARSKTVWTLIGIGGHLAMSPLPHHRAYGSVPRRFGQLSGHVTSR